MPRTVSFEAEIHTQSLAQKRAIRCCVLPVRSTSEATSASDPHAAVTRPKAGIWIRLVRQR